MDPSGIARFATSCGAFAPLEFAIEYHDGVVAATGTLNQPFALIGRSPTCDIALDAEDLLPQSAFLQVVGGQVFVGDLGTRTGLRWHHGRHPYGWMYPLEPIQIGPFALKLMRAASPHPAPFGASFHPLIPGPDMPQGLPSVEIEFLNGKSDRPRWSVNRVLTLVGSAPDCKIHLSSEEIAPRHCYLLHAPDGLWIVDLTGQSSIRVNDEPVRFARLGEGDLFQIGRFRMNCTYPYSSPHEGMISFDEVPRQPVKTEERSNDSFSKSSLSVPPVQTPVRQTTKPRTDFDRDVPPPGADEPTDWNEFEDTDPIDQNLPAPVPPIITPDEMAQLLPVNELGLPDSGFLNEHGNPKPVLPEEGEGSSDDLHHRFMQTQ